MTKKVLIGIVLLYIATVFILEFTIVIEDIVGGLDKLRNLELKLLNKLSFNTL